MYLMKNVLFLSDPSRNHLRNRPSHIDNKHRGTSNMPPSIEALPALWKPIEFIDNKKPIIPTIGHDTRVL